MNLFYLLMLSIIIVVSEGQRRKLRFINFCKENIWISPSPNSEYSQHPRGIQLVAPNRYIDYPMADQGWAGRFVPKFGCDANGQYCTVGQALDPCKGGCDPPANTLIEFNFPPFGGVKEGWYDISLVDGYTVSATISPDVKQQGGSCVTTSCKLTEANCPSNEIFGLGSLRSYKGKKFVYCLSPCRRYTFTKPFGLNKPETDMNGRNLCCPTGVTPEQCNRGPVVQTQYVRRVRQLCRNAYSFSYDDHHGLHNCPNGASYTVKFCT